MADETPKAPPSVYEHLAMMLDQMASVSWQKLGLQPDPMSNRIEMNLPEAKVAIDTAAHLVNALESSLDDDDRRKVQGLIRDLRVNFVRKTNEAGS